MRQCGICFYFAAWLFSLKFIYVCPVERLPVSYNRKQPVYGLVAYIIDDEAVRFPLLPFLLRIFPCLWIVRKQRIRPLCKQGVYISV